MKIHVIKLLLVITSTMVLNTCLAQLFHPKDSVRKQRIVQVGLGGYMGVNHVKPINQIMRYQIANGYDKGLLADLKVNITNYLSVKSGLRMSEQTAMLGYGNNTFFESFHLTMNRQTVPMLISFKANHAGINLFDVELGIAYNNISFRSTNNNTYWLLTYYFGSQYTGGYWINYQNVSALSYILNINKEYKIKKSLFIQFFSELDILSKTLDIQDAYRMPDLSIIQNQTPFMLYSIRLGVAIKY